MISQSLKAVDSFVGMMRDSYDMHSTGLIRNLRVEWGGGGRMRTGIFTLSVYLKLSGLDQNSRFLFTTGTGDFLRLKGQKQASEPK